MTTVNEDLRSFLLSIPELAGAIDTRVYELHVPVRDETSGMPDVPFVWMSQSAADYERTTDQQVGEDVFRYGFDVEVVSDTVAESIQLANIIRAHLDSFRGPGFGTRTIKGAFVDDQTDNYVTRNPAADLGLSVASLLVSIFP